MKKLFAVVLFLVLAAFVFAASEEIALYTYIFNNVTDTYEGQLELLQSMAEQDVKGAGEFYAKALERLVRESGGIKNATQQSFANEQAILLSKLIGQEKYAAAAGNLWRVVDSFSAPLVRAEAMMALGKIRATQFLPQIIKILNDLNEAQTNDPMNSERIAYGAIVALEKYQDIKCYLPVYFASKAGWYTERVKSQAAKSMEIICPDPTQPMIEVLKSPAYNYEIKTTALLSMEASNAPKASKAAVALVAYNEAWTSATTDVRLIGQLRTMRKIAMRVIRANGCSDPAVYPLLHKSYIQYAESDRSDADQDETTQAILTLSALGTEQAAKNLSGYITDILGKLKSGTLRRKEESLVRELIPALGATKQPAGKDVLNAVIYSNFTEAVKKLARDALGQIQ